MAYLKRDDDKFGAIAEKLAADLFRREGYVVRETNWRPTRSHKEIDIIAQKGQTIVFAEVKARNERGIDPLDAVTPRKIRNMVAAARSYLAAQDVDYDFRFDVVSVIGSSPDDLQVEHICDAFLPPLSSK